MKVKFIDGPAAVDIVDLEHHVNVHAVRGEYVEVPDEVGAKLLDQEWQTTPKGKESANAATAAEEK